MFGDAPTTSRRERVRSQTLDAIVDAAWTLSRQDGLQGWSMRRLADACEMAAPSLYTYVDGKHAVYDEMFRRGWDEFGAGLPRPTAELREAEPSEQRRLLGSVMQRAFDEASSDPVRFQLLFQRTIPGFEPSARSYEAAVRVLEELRGAIAAVGIDDPAALDMWTAIFTGLTSQQIANEPGGSRWGSLVEPAVEMFLDTFQTR